MEGFAKRFNIGVEGVKRLRRLADSTARAQEREHNTGEDSAASVRLFEKVASEYGFKVTWPGLYPLLHKNGETAELPE